MLILLTGIPGTGKTTIGEFLESQRGYLHIDMEVLLASAPANTRWPDILAALEERCRMHEDFVVSWGFIPGRDEPIVRALQDAGFRLVWFDGNREAARRAFLRRGTVAVNQLDLQMDRIARLDLAALHPAIVNPFDGHGEFRTPAQITAEILAVAEEPQ